MAGSLAVGFLRFFAIVGAHTFEVGQYDIAVEGVPVLRPSMFNHGVGYGALVAANEIVATTRARLLIRHGPIFADRAPALRARIGRLVLSEEGEGADDDQDAEGDLANAEKSHSPERVSTRRLGGVEPEPSLERRSYASSWISRSSSRCRPYLPSHVVRGLKTLTKP